MAHPVQVSTSVSARSSDMRAFGTILVISIWHLTLRGACRLDVSRVAPQDVYLRPGSESAHIRTLAPREYKRDR